MSAISSILKHFESRQFKDIFTIFCIFIDNIFPRFLHSSFLRAAQHSARHVMAAKLSSLCIMFAVCIVSIITTSTVLYVSTLYISTIYLQYLQYIYYIYNIYIYTSIPESISIPIHLFQNLIRTDYFESVLSVLCVSEVIVRYFHLTTFFWMFLEGKLVLPIYDRLSFGTR